MIIFVIGAPCVGKTTFCASLQKWCNFYHLSLGEILRNNCEFRNEIEYHMKNGLLLPSNLVFKVLEKELNGKRGLILIDGFPRSTENIEWWRKLVEEKPIAVLHLVCRKEVINQRYESRTLTSTRLDDRPEILVRRLKSYEQNTAVLDTYKDILHELNTEGTISEVFIKGFNLIDSILSSKNLFFHDGSILKWHALSDDCVPPKKGTPFSIGMIFSRLKKKQLSRGVEHLFEQTWRFSFHQVLTAMLLVVQD